MESDKINNHSGLMQIIMKSFCQVGRRLLCKVAKTFNRDVFSGKSFSIDQKMVRSSLASGPGHLTSHYEGVCLALLQSSPQPISHHRHGNYRIKTSLYGSPCPIGFLSHF